MEHESNATPNPKKPSPYFTPPKEIETRKRTEGPRNWISAPESGSDLQNPVSYAKTRSLTPLRCQIPEKPGDTCIGEDSFLGSPLPSVSYGSRSLSPSLLFSFSVWLVLPMPLCELCLVLSVVCPNIQYKSLVRILVYIHYQFAKTQRADKERRAKMHSSLKGEFTYETSSDEAGEFLKEVSIGGGKTMTLPPLLDKALITEKVGAWGHGCSQVRKFSRKSKPHLYVLAFDSDLLSKISEDVDAHIRKQSRTDEMLHVEESYNSFLIEESTLIEAKDYRIPAKPKDYEKGNKVVIIDGFKHPYWPFAVPMFEGKVSNLTTSRKRIYAMIRYLASRYRIRGFFKTVKGLERVCLVDIKSSHPTMLIYVLRTYLLKQQNKGVVVDNALYELDQYAELIHTGLLYEDIQGKEKRQESKIAFQKFLNDEAWHYPIIKEWFERRFPELGCIIVKFQENSANPNSPISRLCERLQVPEAKIIMRMVEHCRKFGIPVIPVVDEIMVPESKGEMMAEILLNTIHSIAGVEGGVSVDYYDENAEDFSREVRHRYSQEKESIISPPMKAIPPCPEDLCPDCWSENKAILIASSFPCKHIKDNVAKFPIHPKGDTGTNAG